MSVGPFTKRLTAAHGKAGLSIKEMAIWFDDIRYENLSAADRPMPPETVARLKALWAAELKDNPLPW